MGTRPFRHTDDTCPSAAMATALTIFIRKHNSVTHTPLASLLVRNCLAGKVLVSESVVYAFNELLRPPSDCNTRGMYT